MKATGTFILLLCIIWLHGIAQHHNPIVAIDINMNKPVGVVRSLHGGNIGPIELRGTLDFTEYFQKCKIPSIRLHDVPWFGFNAVDISTIFKNDREDPGLEENYDFRITDDYIASIIKTGAEIVYRLGESIEYTDQKYNVNPPEDFEKWAEVCEHIIEHYNEGWANGFHYNIKYWEIWNEPNNTPNCWTGTSEQFFRLFEITSKKLKSEFPNLKIGGPSVGAAAIMENGRVEVYNFTDKFLRYCKNNSVPIDFFSWHKYSADPWEMARFVTYTRNILDQYGYSNAESHLNEWNYIPNSLFIGGYDQGVGREEYLDEQSSVKGGAFIADVLMLLQDHPVDVANLYTVGYGLYGLFSFMGIPHKSSYAFQAFADLVNYTPVRLETKYNTVDSLVICAGMNKERTMMTVLISNFTSSSRKLNFILRNSILDGPIEYKVLLIDDLHDFSNVKTDTIYNHKEVLNISEKVEGPSVALLKFSMIKQ